MAETATRELLRLHAEAMSLFSRTVHRVRDDQWGSATPCTDWSVRELVNHLTVEQLWVPPLVTGGATVAEVGDRFDGDQLGPDPVEAWDRAASGARESWLRPGALDRTVHLSMGESSGAEYCSEMTMDATVHAWDLARAIGADERIPDSLVDFSMGEVEPYAGTLAASGLFEPPVPVPDNADPQTRLLALLGRAA